MSVAGVKWQQTAPKPYMLLSLSNVRVLALDKEIAIPSYRPPQPHRTDTALACQVEQIPWVPSDRHSPSRRAYLAARGPYEAAIPATIATRDFALPAHIEAGACDAAIALARFDAYAATVLPAMPEETLPAIAPLDAVLLRSEASASSQIENINAYAIAVALAAIDAKPGPAARLVTANTEAVVRATNLAETLAADAILAAHEALLAGHDYAEPGRLRSRQVWIGSGGSSPHDAMFVPPTHHRVPAAIDDLVEFCARTDINPLAHAAIAHAQFETIHPFVDGNGRTGRALFAAMLRKGRVTRDVTVPVSSGLLADLGGYFDALTAYREGDPAPIVARFTSASFQAVNSGTQLVDDVAEAHARWVEQCRFRAGSTAARMMPLLLRQPAVSVGFIAQALRVSPTAASSAIEQCVAAEILMPATEQRRNRVWIATEITAILDQFMIRTGRIQRR